uniref:NADH dehydrogenase subunit 4L n=1 Tax=Malacocephalus laevis TaxID=630738 RepID=UPI0028FC98E6|nr:NADH dehydrogenase subunit 4L [Malacocephalus laevis]WNH37764.1 NADH dehydrogenase subunit 4L [Malacocephalus laevis]
MSPATLSASLTFILTFLGLSFHRTHLLSALICLEGMLLSLFTASSLSALQSESPNASSNPLCILTFSACEASTGLALLVATARTHGTDHLKKLNLLKC